MNPMCIITKSSGTSAKTTEKYLFSMNNFDLMQRKLGDIVDLQIFALSKQHRVHDDVCLWFCYSQAQKCVSPPLTHAYAATV